MIRTTRRQLLRASSTAALLAAVRAAFPAGAFAQSPGPEVKKAKMRRVKKRINAILLSKADSILFMMGSECFSSSCN